MVRIPLLVLSILLAVALAPSGLYANGGAKFGDRVAGSYLLRVDHEGFPTIHALVHITSEGGFLGSDASDFGAAGTPLNSPIYGAWERSGRREITARTLYIGFDLRGEPTALTRTTGSFRFDKGFQTGEGEMLIELFRPEDDPLDPDAEPFDTLRATLTAKRISVPANGHKK